MLAAATLASTALATTGAATALASAPSVTLSGEAGDESTPASKRDRVTSVQATLNGSTPAGTLHTEGSFTGGTGPYSGFDGQVSCVVLAGKRVTVGAFGEAWQVAEGSEEHKPLPGSYAQLLTVEFAKVRVSGPFGETTVSESFKALGTEDQGVSALSPPDCHSGSFEGLHPDANGALYLSPSISSPLDGAVDDTGSVTLSGTAEPGAVVAIYEPAGSAAAATVVNADLDGGWTATLSPLAIGVHVFSAFVLPGSTIPSNTVEIEEIAPTSTTTPTATGGTTTVQIPGHGVLSSTESKQAQLPFAHLTSTSLSVSAGGWLTLAVACPASERICVGNIKLHTALTLASGPFRVRGAHSARVRLRLSPRGRALLARNRRLPVRATIRAHDLGGVSRTTEVTVTLRAAGRHHR
jgi:hypothetical protein